ncbi:hypothetical protein D6779_02215 [Candidatus Parcubacteria bacterium]|nr:MAG: hypothetical protein D6779_02215 [Candidatus Parcubacteria bacterium]
MKNLLDKINKTKPTSKPKPTDVDKAKTDSGGEDEGLKLAVHNGFVRIHVRHPIRGHETTVSLDENIAALVAKTVMKKQGKTLTGVVQEIVNEALTLASEKPSNEIKSLSRLVQAELVKRLTT